MNEILEICTHPNYDVENCPILKTKKCTDCQFVSNSSRVVSYTSPVPSGVQNGGRFIDGLMYAVQHIIVERDEPLFAKEIMQNSGYSKKDLIEAQKLCGYEDKRIIKVINEIR